MDPDFDYDRPYPHHVHDAWAETLAQQRERRAQASRDGYGTDAYSYPGMDDSPPQPPTAPAPILGSIGRQ